MMKKILVIIAVFFGVISVSYSQTTILVNSANNGTTQAGCSLLIYDSGGNSGNYSSNQDYKVSFQSNNPSSLGLKLTALTNSLINNADTLWIYDGDGTSSSQLFHGGVNNLTFFNASNPIMAGKVFQSSVSNTSRKITLRFKSSGTTAAPGFGFSLNCFKLCQPFFARFDTIHTTPNPHSNAIALCPLEMMHLVAYGDYSMSDTLSNPKYHQSDTSSTFTWNFGDGNSQTGIGLSSVNYSYLQSGKGYNVTLAIKDTNGCESSNKIGLRVMTSKNPIDSIRTIADICYGTPFMLSVGSSDSSTIVLKPGNYNQIAPPTNTDTNIFIPDGICNGVSCLSNPITVTGYDASQSIQSSSEILSICIKIEHSWVGDLRFQLVCPNGQTINLMNTTQPNQHGGADLGISNFNNHWQENCNPALNPPGIGWTYCWSEQPSYTYHGTLHSLSTGTSPIDSTNRTNHSNYIIPDDSFSGLIGCPIAGTWSLVLCDLWQVDNGYLFGWDLNLTATPWDYHVGIQNVDWSGTYLSNLSDSSVLVTPIQAGEFNTTFSITDSFGCSFDTILPYHVLELPEPQFVYTASTSSPEVSFTNQTANATSYLWDFGVNSDTSTEINPIYAYPANGQYTVVLTASDGNCTNTYTQDIYYNQTTILVDSANNGTTQVGCTFLIYDNGGESGNYSNNQDYTLSFESNNPNSLGLKLTALTNSLINNADTLWIYDGDGTSTSQLFHGGINNLTFFNASNPIMADNVFQSSVYNTSHKITLRFKSSGTTTESGFGFSLNCSKPCQPFFARIDTILSTPNPDSNYIALCPFEMMHLVAYGDYSMSDTLSTPNYLQSDTTSTFTWNFGDGNSQTGIGLSSVNYSYVQSGNGYNLTLVVKDTIGCESNNKIGLRVMTSKNPIEYVNTIPNICSGTPFILSFGSSDSSTIVLKPGDYSQFVPLNMTIDTSIFIPDGICNGDSCLSNSIVVTGFDVSQSIQSSSDILSICIKMEHSYVGDLRFQLVCPNGQRINLMNTTATGQHGGADLGIANSQHSNSEPCNSALNPPGIGWTYCWSEQPSYTYHGTLHSLSTGTSPIDSTNRTNHSNYIIPDDSFSGLIGCPIAGAWSLILCDLWGFDNGYLFGWDLNFIPIQTSAPWDYHVGVQYIDWSGPNLSYLSDSSILVTLPQAGDYNTAFSITDSFGCSFDTLVTHHVLQSPEPQFSYTTSSDSPEVSFTNQTTNATSYLWDFGVNSETSTETNPIYTYPANGQYTVALKASNSNCTNTYTQYIGINVGINENENSFVNIYPNPTSGIVYVKFDKPITESTEVHVIDLAGKIVYRKTLSTIGVNNREVLDLSNLAGGLYHLRIKNNSQMNDKVILIQR